MNMELKCLIIDDQLFAAEHLSRLILKIRGLVFIGIETNPLVARDKIISGELNPDLVFMDISMPEKNGLELADELKDYTTTIFTTAHPDHEAKAFEVEAIDYLLKPITYERFNKCINKVKRLLSLSYRAKARPLKDYLVITGYSKGSKISIAKDEIYYIESAKNYINIYTSDRKFAAHMATKSIEAQLSGDMFKRSQKSFIVNATKVSSIKGNTIHLCNEVNVPLGGKYRTGFLEFLSSDSIVPGKG